jgi:hypothetical protein
MQSNYELFILELKYVDYKFTNILPDFEVQMLTNLDFYLQNMIYQ